MNALKSGRVNEWSLLYLIIGTYSLAVLVYMKTQDLSVSRGVTEMIRMSVRCSVPFLYPVFFASALNILFSRMFSRWLLRNRRYVASMG